MINKLNSNIIHVKTIFQISDVHIRHFKRHDDYLQVFENLYSILKSKFDSNSIIVISGDILHNKQQLVPEQIQVMSNFLEALSDIGPTVIFPGNHDANINNLNRLDSITPIINILKKSNIFYLKNSGLYEFADNIIFSNMSVFDSVESYILSNDIPHNDRKKIALYHGTINGAFTDTKYQLKTSKIMQSMFDGFDFVLLGDIHAQQIIQKRKIENLEIDELEETEYIKDGWKIKERLQSKKVKIYRKKPDIVYVGSLIQQNYGESLENHGIIEWNVENETYNFIKVQNKYGYLTLNIKNGIIENLPNNIMENPRFRLLVSKTTHSELKECIIKLRSDYNPIELTVNSIDTFIDDENIINNKIDLSNIRNVEFQNNLVKDYIKRNFNDVDDDSINKILEINRYLNSLLPIEDLARNIIWKPEIFKFSNMFSFGEDNIIDFSKMSGLVGLFAPNTAGKTSVLESLMFCLFGKCTRAFKASHILNNRENQFSCELLLDIFGEKYVINRTAKKSKDSTVKVKVNFYKILPDGTTKSLNGEQRVDTDSIIKSYIGTFDDFVLTALRSQKKPIDIIDLGQSDRKDLLSTFADITIFDKLLELGNTQIKEYQVLLKEFKKNDYDLDLSKIESDLLIEEGKYTEFKINKKSLISKKQELDENILLLVSALIKIECDVSDINLVENEKTSANLKLEELKIKFNENNNDVLSLINTLNDKKDIINKFVNDDIEAKNSKLLKLEKELEELNVTIDKFKISITQKKKQAENLLKLEYDPNCKFCMNNIFVKEAIDVKSQLEKDKVVAMEYLTNRKNLTSEIELLSDVKNDYKKYNDEKLEFNKTELKLSNKRLAGSGIDNDLKSYSLKLEKLNDSIAKYYKSKDDIKANDDTNKKIADLKSKVYDVNSKILFVENNLTESYSKILFFKNEKNKIMESMQKFKEIEEKNRCYEYYLQAIHRDAIPYELISNIVPFIEHEANNALAQMVDFGILLELDGKNINIKIAYDENKVWYLETSSGKEGFIAALVLRIALIKVTNLPKPNFLAIDEGFGTLDSDSTADLPMLLDYFRTKFDFVFIISHMEYIRDYVDMSLDLTKNSEGFSKVLFD